MPLRGQVLERADGLLDRRQRVLGVDLVEVDIVGAEPLQAGLDRIHDVPTRGAAIVRALAHGAGRLGGEHDIRALPARIAHRRAGDRLAEAFGINICGVDEIDPRIERSRDEGIGHRLVELADSGPEALAAEGHGAETEFGDEQARPAEGVVTHGARPSTV